MNHESTHVWQWNGNGMAPAGLITGIVDYERLKAGCPSTKWVKRGCGSSDDFLSILEKHVDELWTDYKTL
ncbi:hypothetical protein CDL15_Pgr008204 [Punica granatum]|uniref:Uncharacterized protein n=1 Tax=Punica granatum TaxID=22663 RepID=A0A218VUG4_PUNGR|nr:hypothetical protein CDL15_Pgr008204 [Punica granatum]